MTGERKILTLKRKSLPEHQDKNSETPGRVSRKKIIVEAAPNLRKKNKPTEPRVEKGVQPNVPYVEISALRVREPKPIKPPRQKRTLSYDEAVSIMQGYWPGLFEGQQPRLLKIDIREDLYRDIEQRGLALSHKVLRRCLISITRSSAYLSQIHIDAPRYNLAGIVEGHVNEQECQFALESLAKIKGTN
ncbi:ProQ/FINO family protein [Yersinia frederiksenii]|uniref:ProQ/FINO family protein n=1 Tax=Yersinia frederiksenii TaxID=29484 RepID=UPI0005E8CE4D|nr:ProQ/FINO family protein [Yersinia frederiksenii]CQJ05417.1 conjugal transfer fertility inhibition protein FinO [Yersinia frederiksenii]